MASGSGATGTVRWLPGAAAALGLALVLGLVYLPAAGGELLNWDDDRFLADNPRFAGPVWPYVEAALTEPQFEAYQPLHLLSYVPDRLLWPDWAPGFHILNLAIFWAALLALVAFGRRHVAPRYAYLGALLFALHPLCVEPVAWITSRKDLLALLFSIGVLLLEDADAPRPRTRALALLTFALALASKTSAICLPAVVAAWLIFVRGLPLRRALLRVLPHLVLALAAGLGTLLLWSEGQLIPPRPVAAPVDVAMSLGFYLQQIAVPMNLAPLYPAVPQAPWGGGAPWLYAAIAGASLTAVALAWRRMPGLARFAAVAFLAALAPVANLIPLYWRFADRYALFALAVLAVPAAAALQWLATHASARRRQLLWAAVAALVALEAVAAHRQARAWSSSASLWQRSVAAQPEAYFGHLKLGETLRDAGRFDAAQRAYEGAIRLTPERPLGYVGLFTAYAAEAEAAGRLPAGTWRGWLARLGPAAADPAAFNALAKDVDDSGCRPCAASLMVLGLRSFPQKDATLLDQAERFLRSGRPDLALVYLDAVADRGTTRYRLLLDAALEARE